MISSDLITTMMFLWDHDGGDVCQFVCVAQPNAIVIKKPIPLLGILLGLSAQRYLTRYAPPPLPLAKLFCATFALLIVKSR
jgi:hypothetical protein